jgi:hypothetical protein
MNILAVDGKPVPDGANVRLDKDMARIETTRDNGGSAFPVRSRWDSGQESFDLDDSGMTLRDYFAAHAIDTARRVCEKLRREGLPTVPNEAEIAYRIADMMLKVRDWEGG